MFEGSAQERVRAFVSQHSLEASVEARIMDLTSEVGEVSKEYLTATSYGYKEFQAAPEWQDELGDVYFALLSLADKSGVDLEKALEGSMAKYERRLKKMGGPDVHRSEDLER